MVVSSLKKLICIFSCKINLENLSITTYIVRLGKFRNLFYLTTRSMRFSTFQLMCDNISRVYSDSGYSVIFFFSIMYKLGIPYCLQRTLSYYRAPYHYQVCFPILYCSKTFTTSVLMCGKMQHPQGVY